MEQALVLISIQLHQRHLDQAQHQLTSQLKHLLDHRAKAHPPTLLLALHHLPHLLRLCHRLYRQLRDQRLGQHQLQLKYQHLAQHRDPQLRDQLQGQLRDQRLCQHQLQLKHQHLAQHRDPQLRDQRQGQRQLPLQRQHLDPHHRLLGLPLKHQPLRLPLHPRRHPKRHVFKPTLNSLLQLTHGLRPQRHRLKPNMDRLETGVSVQVLPGCKTSSKIALPLTKTFRIGMLRLSQIWVECS
mmetsp:Transcript_30850/g.74112  ORF Transcript_30850/g.74112 Transcript_30850/m.74112 type:complete len:240 (+) Transcript_30850:509-1228(+)